MVQKTITVSGRSVPDMDVNLNKPDISGPHARITDLENGKYKIEDLDSANGTYVNGYRIKTSTVSSNDQVRLSASHIIDLEVLFKKKQGRLLRDIKDTSDDPIKSNPKDFTEEFAQLAQVHDDFYDKMDKIDDTDQLKQTLIRIGLMSIPMLLVMSDQKAFAGASLILGSLPQIFSKQSKKRKKKQAFIDDFMRRYTCPNKDCNQMLYGRSWNVWHDTGECPRCKAIFNKNKL